MQKASKIHPEAAAWSRLQELSWLRILDTPAEERFDRYTRLVADVFNVPTVIVGLIDEDRQWYKSAVGADWGGDIPTDVTFCVHALATGFLEIPDARQDARFRDSPFVVSAPNIRFYAGAVLYGPTGQPLGTLGLFDDAPRTLTAVERTRLIAFAKLVQDEINIEKRNAVTGLPAAAAMEAQLNCALERPARERRPLAIIHLGVINYAKIVSLDGLTVGGALILEFSRRLRQLVRKTDILGHIHADRFVAVIDAPEDRQDNETRVRRLIDQLAAPVQIGQDWQRPALAAGVARYPDDGTTAKALLDSARAAAHSAAVSGKNGAVCFYSRRLYEHVRWQHDQTRRLAEALERGRLHQVYQPFIDLETGQVAAFEALARWHDPGYGDVSPGVFIPLSDADPDLRHALTTWSLRTACRQIADLNAQRPNHLRVSVNIPGAELQRGDFAPALRALLARYQVRAEQIILELTEQSLIANLDAVVAVMTELRADGVQFAVDDFGTGYSSLGYLRQLPLDMVKIDRCFIQDIATDPSAYELTRGVINISGALGLQGVAEGIETEAQLAALHALGCNKGQGFLLARPASGQQLLNHLRERNGWS